MRYIFGFIELLYLFPLNDVPTMITPVTALGTFSALSGQFHSVKLCPAIFRIRRTFLWVWLNVLVFSVSNQREAGSILEDSLNKPWRLIPSGKCTPEQARRLMLVLTPLVLFTCYFHFGATEETGLCLLTTWLYNDLGGTNEHFTIRNGLNGIAYVLYGSGALRIALGRTDKALPCPAYGWLGPIAMIIFTTMLVQDLKDQVGDRARNRSTTPLDLGDGVSRWSVAIGVAIWSVGGTQAFSAMLLQYYLRSFYPSTFPAARNFR